eukprot:TRINITY_DN3096_c1_g1_i1.p1 TRINITY_DN3096_c1_g1~~TRINITY_DN3096_c1_g1_i1.p1  ORF type:complete len:492 (-),score=64.74 TRINITY_DN3096_c1_g1_i1:970-2445(-)
MSATRFLLSRCCVKLRPPHCTLARVSYQSCLFPKHVYSVSHLSRGLFQSSPRLLTVAKPASQPLPPGIEPSFLAFNSTLPPDAYKNLSSAMFYWSAITSNLPHDLDPRAFDALSTSILPSPSCCDALNEVVALLRRHEELIDRQKEAVAFAASDSDPEVLTLVLDDLRGLQSDLVSVDSELAVCLADLADIIRWARLGVGEVSSVELRVSSGVGGKEAGIFATELMEMYRAFCCRRGWRIDEGSDTSSAAMAAGEMAIVVHGAGDGEVFRVLSCEAGIHRVQRVPSTETSGRPHTSAAAVVVTPILDVSQSMSLVPERDLNITYTRASTKGGQRAMHVESGCKLHHIPSGTSIEVQCARTKRENEDIARRKIASLVLLARQEQMRHALSAVGAGQVAGTDRSDKIRTFNFPSQRVTDHRSGTTVDGNLDKVLYEGQLDELVDAVLETRRKDAVGEGLSLVLSTFEPPPPLPMKSANILIKKENAAGGEVVR